MGCSSSKRARIVHRRSPPASLHRSLSAPGGSERRKSSGCGGAAITPLRIRFDSMAVKETKIKDRFLDEKELRRTMTENRQRPDMSLEVFQAKTWSATVGRKLSGGPITPAAVLPPRTQLAEEKVAPEIISAWELMAELADSSSSDDNSSCSDSGSSMERPVSPEYNSLPEVGSLRYSPESVQSPENGTASPGCLSDGECLSHSPESARSPENGPASPDLSADEKAWEDGEVEMERSEFPEPKWDLVEQDESLPSELDACFISVFGKSSESSPELEDHNNEESENATEITLSSPLKEV